MNILDGKNAIITGARRGIGRSTVEVFAKNGANVWACARRQDGSFEEDMRNLSEKYGVEIIPLYFDTTDDNELKIAVKEIRKWKRPVDVLVNMAGIVEESTSFTMTSMEKMRKVFEVNYFGVSQLTQYIARLMIKQNNGVIINVSSVAGLDGTPAQYEYASSKAAVIGATKQLSHELGKYNIRVNAVAPGVVDTEMGAKIGEELLSSTLEKTIMKRMAKPEEIANVIMFLSSDLSSYMTGQVVRGDGGGN